ncbi:prenyltransferase [Ignicoccus pacificus DSM 13166]|uniref:Prenyltransferase n=1 Tax=Ignicoccus pacificus DSM 13166 TaxID=940294 RepID=A0A977K8Y7_9CREN|nr:prenyltransferase [Ignicoccus pacificus DSM 13166]
MGRSSLKLKDYAELIRIEHTLFSLPFAYSGAVLVRIPTLKEVILIFTALFGIRSYSLIINNLVDAEIDKANPRTANRPIPSGRVSKGEALGLAAASLAIYFISAYLLNKYAFILSPIFPILATVYPFLKRYVPIAHFWLGAILGGAVIGGAIAVSGDAPNLISALLRVPWTYVVAVSAWVASFDALYAILDIDFDRSMGLHSLPADFGIKRAIRIAEITALIFAIAIVYSVSLYKLNILGSSMSAAGLFLHSKLFGMAEVNPEEAARRSLNTSLIVGLLVGGAPLTKLIP